MVQKYGKMNRTLCKYNLEALALKVVFSITAQWMQYILFDGKTDIIENKGKNGKQVAGTT
jgi:hypothetical protein